MAHKWTSIYSWYELAQEWITFKLIKYITSIFLEPDLTAKFIYVYYSFTQYLEFLPYCKLAPYYFANLSW